MQDCDVLEDARQLDSNQRYIDQLRARPLYDDGRETFKQVSVYEVRSCEQLGQFEACSPKQQVHC
jgi:hypothetical protein